MTEEEIRAIVRDEYAKIKQEEEEHAALMEAMRNTEPD